MTWLTAKHGLKKAWLWTKTHWYVPVVVIAALGSYIFFRGKAKGVIEAFMQNREGYKHQVKKLNELHEKEIKLREGLVEKRDKKLEEIEDAKDKEVGKIEKEKEERVKELKNRDLKNLADKLGKEFDL